MDEDSRQILGAIDTRLKEVMCTLQSIEIMVGFFFASADALAVIYLFGGALSLRRFGVYVILVAGAFCVWKLDRMTEFRRGY